MHVTVGGGVQSEDSLWGSILPSNRRTQGQYQVTLHTEPSCQPQFLKSQMANVGRNKGSRAMYPSPL